MLDIAPQQILAIVGLILILLELYVGVETGFDLLIIGLILFFSGLIAPDLSIAGIFTIILASGYFFLGRKLLKSKLSKKTWDKLNTDKLIGATATVIKRISSSVPGLVQLGDEQWRATANQEIKSGAKVVVTGLEGITLIVEIKK
ncbi:MAG TPA: NfeD family protein [Candidatus Woesebacteria bacterium]|nr:NfeD family protein [Candidatus Woesebacteria bacterium]